MGRWRLTYCNWQHFTREFKNDQDVILNPVLQGAKVAFPFATCAGSWKTHFCNLWHSRFAPRSTESLSHWRAKFRDSASPHCVKHKARRHVLHTDIWHGLAGQLRNLWWCKLSKLSPPMTPRICTFLFGWLPTHLSLLHAVSQGQRHADLLPPIKRLSRAPWTHDGRRSESTRVCPVF